jgi:hypothetical protein
MDQAIGNIRKPLTQEEKDKRRAQGLCLYCGNPGHFARECPAKGPKRPRLEPDPRLTRNQNIRGLDYQEIENEMQRLAPAGYAASQVEEDTGKENA